MESELEGAIEHEDIKSPSTCNSDTEFETETDNLITVLEENRNMVEVRYPKRDRKFEKLSKPHKLVEVRTRVFITTHYLHLSSLIRRKRISRSY